MTVTLEQAKTQLRITDDEQDMEILEHLNGARAAVQGYAGANYSADAEDIRRAELMLLDYWFAPDDKVPLDPMTGFPIAVASLLRRYRTPTVA